MNINIKSYREEVKLQMHEAFEEEYLRGYKQGFKDRARQSDLEHETCENCRYCDEFRDDILHCTYFEQFFPIEIGKCNKLENK